MAKKNKEDFTYSIEEFIAPLKESDKNDWVKGVARIKWGDNPTTLDIRNINLASNSAYRGISLSDEEADTLVKILLDNGYGSIQEIIEALEQRKSMFEYMTIDQAREELDYILIDTDGMFE